MDALVENDTCETHWELSRDDSDKFLNFLFPDEVLFPKGMGELPNNCISRGLYIPGVNPASASGSSEKEEVGYWPGAPQLDTKPTAHEGLLASFFNLVIAIVNQACVMATIRVWSADSATCPLSGGDAMRKPDLSCWLDAGSKFDWRHLTTFAKVKNCMGKDNEKSSYIEMAGKASCLLYAQDSCHAAPCLHILGSQIYLMVFDWGTSLSTCGYDMHHYPCEFLCILIGVMSAPCNILRFDISINWGKRSCPDGKVVDVKELKIEMDATTCTIELTRVLFISDNLFSWGTTVWEGMMKARGTSGMQARKVAVKDSWIDPLQKYTEGKILSILNVCKIEGVPMLVHEEQVKAPYLSVVDCLWVNGSTHFPQAYLAHYKTNSYYLRILSHIITHPVGDLITEFSCLGELLVTFLDYIVEPTTITDSASPTLPIKQLSRVEYECNFVPVMPVNSKDAPPSLTLVSDLTKEDNIVLTMGPASVENDLQHTIDTSPLHHTGTWSWMAAQLVMAGAGQLVVHDASHNLESFFYVLVGICILLDKPYKPKCNSKLGQCFDKYFNTFEPSMLKTIVIQSDLTWKPFILQHISDYFKPIISLLTCLRNAIIVPLSTDEHGNVSHKTPFTHDMFIATIIQTLSELGPDVWMAINQAGNDDQVGPRTEIEGENSLELVDIASEVNASPDNYAGKSSNEAIFLSNLPFMLPRPTPHWCSAGPGYSVDSGLALSSHARQERSNDLDLLEVPNKHQHSSSCDTEPDQLRHSSHAGRGDGRQLRQLHNIESIQTARHLQPSTQNLDMAMQDEPVNPMAPDYPEDEQESQILLWVVELIPPFAEQSPKVQPLFKHSQPSQPFGFKLPSQASTGSTQSTRSSNSDSSSDEDGLVIDEVSPSEDDCCAEAVVHGETGDPGHSSKLDEKHSQSGTLQFQGDHGSTNMQQREIEDIVIQHHQRNCAPQLPDNTQLLAVDALDSLEGPISKTSSSSTKAAPTPLLATSVASGIVPNSNSDPSHLQFYTLLVRDIIKHAKQISHCNIVSINSFPLHAEFNHKAPEYMNEAIAKHCS
ncbi:hypothetical protein EDC04DRAFT_2906180 [Pisolithus marmoratus]|nr:hypothetical protein EDC04DRAFT_2906180 [Pisolithus marmoratus]